MPNIIFSPGKQDIEKSYMREEAASAIENLFAKTKADNIHLAVVSAYRSYEQQNKIFNNGVKTKGLEATPIVVPHQGQVSIKRDLLLILVTSLSDMI